MKATYVGFTLLVQVVGTEAVVIASAEGGYPHDEADGIPDDEE